MLPLANLRQYVISVLSHLELRMQPAPMMAIAGPSPRRSWPKRRAPPALPADRSRRHYVLRVGRALETAPIAPDRAWPAPARPGPARRATPPAHAAQAKNSSTATAGSDDLTCYRQAWEALL